MKHTGMTIIKDVRRFDKGEISNVEKTPQGFLKVPGFVTRIGIFPYMDSNGNVRKELRHPDDVFAPESLATLKNAVVTLEHPPVMVEPANFKEYSVGYTTDRVEVNRDLVEADCIIAKDEAIKAVAEEGVRELSSGYLSDVIEEEGVYNNVPYNYRQKNIRYNHVALVRRGRAGPEVRLRMDSADAAMTEMEKVVISGEEVELPSRLAAVVRDMLDRYDEMRAKLGDLEENMKKDDMNKKDVDISQKGIGAKVPEVQMAPDGRSAAGKVGASDKSGASKAKGDDDDDDKKDAGIAEGHAMEKEPSHDDDDDDKKDKKKDNEAAPMEMLKNEIEHLKQQLEAVTAKHDAILAKHDEMASATEGKEHHSVVPMRQDSKEFKLALRSRMNLERNAEKVLPKTEVEKFDSMTDDEIRAMVIQAKHPKADLVGKSSVYLQSRFDSIVETIEESSSVRHEMGSALMRERMDSESSPVDARKKMIEDSKKLYTSPLSAKRK